MQYVVFSDLHGNADALLHLLSVEKARSEQRFLFCGDICGYYYEARKCVDLLKSIDGLIAVRGNHDQYYLDSFDDQFETEKLAEKYGSSYMDKDKVVRDYIESLPLMRLIESDGKKISVMHGSPKDLLEGRIYPDTTLTGGAYDIYIMGHTHYRMLRRDERGIWLNPGSLGQPRDGYGFSYCKVNTADMKISFHSFEIALDGLLQRARREDPDKKYLEEILHRRK